MFRIAFLKDGSVEISGTYDELSNLTKMLLVVLDNPSAAVESQILNEDGFVPLRIHHVVNL